MKQHKLDDFLDAILKNFSTISNKYEAHLKSHPVLHRMAADPDVTFEIIRRFMIKPGFVKRSNCTPDTHIVVMDRPECFLFCTFFGPNQERRTDISYSTMHHHDDFLLSTLNVKGAGYKSLIFKKGYEINRETMRAHVALDKYVLHKESNIEFIDSHTAHTVFYPEAMTQTFALWSTHFPTNQIAHWKSNPLIQKNKEWIKKGMNLFKVQAKDFKVGQYREDYFYPKNGELLFLPEQVYPKGGDHYIQNFIYITKEFLGMSDSKFFKNIYTDIKNKEGTHEKLIWLEMAAENEKIERNLDGYEMYVDKRNVSIEDYKTVYKIQE